MIIKGFQKLTLLDFPGRVAATVFAPGCDFRCPFCHNASLVLGKGEQPYDEKELLAFLRQRLGRLTGVAITGGEPLMQKGLPDFMAALKDMGYAVKLDTNGSYPERLQSILENKLCDYVAMDIKNNRALYAKTCGLPEEASEGLLQNIDRSIALLQNSGIGYEFRTTVVKELHTRESLLSMAQWMAGEESFYLQCFKDSGDLLQGGLSAYSPEEMQEHLAAVKAFLPRAELRGL